MAHGYAAGLTVISGPAISAGTLSASSGTVIFSNSNGVSFGLSTAAGGTHTLTASAAGGSGGGNLTISAGTQSQSSGSIIFSNANGVSFGLDASTITANYAKLAASAAGASASAGTVVWSNAGNVSFGMAGSTITATATVASSLTNLRLSAGTTSNLLSAVTFADSNGLVFGLDAGTVTGSYTRPVVSNALQDVGTATGSGTNTSRFAADDHVHRGVRGVAAQGTASTFFGDVVVSGGNNITLSTAGASTAGSIAIHAAAQTVQTVGLYASSQTTGESSSSTHDARSITLRGAGIVSVGNSAGQFLVSATTTETPFALSAGTQSVSTGTMVFSDSNGVSFGMSGSSRITAAVPAGATATGNFGALAAGTQTATSGTVLFADSNGLTFGMSASTRITGSYSVPVVSNAIQSVGSATGSGTNTSRFAADDHVHAGLHRISVLGNVAGDTSAGAGSFALAGGPNVTLSGATAAGGMTLSISAPAPGAAAEQNNFILSGNTAGNTTASGSTIRLEGGNNITVSGTNGSVIVVSGPTLPVVSNAIQDVGTATGSGTGITQFAAHDHVHRGVRGIIGQGTASTFYGDFVISGGNNISLSTGGASTAGTVAIHAAAQTNQTEGLYALGNTTGESSSSTFDARTLSVRGDGIVSVGWSNSSLRVSAIQTNQQMTLFATGNTTQSSTGTTNASSVIFRGEGIASVGITGGSIVVSVPPGAAAENNNLILSGNTAGNTTASGSTIRLEGGNNVTLSGTNGSVVVVSAANEANHHVLSGNTTGDTTASGLSLRLEGGDNVRLSGTDGSVINIAAGGTLYEYLPFGFISLGVIPLGQNTLWIRPFQMHERGHFDRVLQWVSGSATGGSVFTVTADFRYGIYTRNASTLSLLNSGSTSFTLNDTNVSNATGFKRVEIISSMTLTPGNYWFGMRSSTSLSSQNAFILDNMIHTAGNQNFRGAFLVASAASNQMVIGDGQYSVTTTNLPASIGFSQITGSVGFRTRPYFGFGGGGEYA